MHASFFFMSRMHILLFGGVGALSLTHTLGRGFGLVRVGMENILHHVCHHSTTNWSIFVLEGRLALASEAEAAAAAAASWRREELTRYLTPTSHSFWGLGGR